MIVKHHDSPAIFRIQRKSDFEKIGLGNAQYERPWLKHQIKKMGKLMGIMSKEEGRFIAFHWRNINKGYPEKFDNYYTYGKD